MRYQDNEPFSVAAPDSQAYRDGYERTFGKDYRCEVCKGKFRTKQTFLLGQPRCPHCLARVLAP